MKVRFTAKSETLALEYGKVYDVMSIEKGWYRIFCELDDDYLFPPEAFEIVDEEKDKPITQKKGRHNGDLSGETKKGFTPEKAV